MPIYEYKCPNGHLLEVFHGMSEPGPAKCEVCGAFPLERVLHPVAVHYKGSGFYSTDYGRAGRKGGKDGGSADSGSSDSGSSDSGSSDSGSAGSGSSKDSGSSSGGGSDGGSKSSGSD
jgi:putative FmdB family regulatory protein